MLLASPVGQARTSESKASKVYSHSTVASGVASASHVAPHHPRFVVVSLPLNCGRRLVRDVVNNTVDLVLEGRVIGDATADFA
jgi:hypothetical protein